jgi:molybdate transport system substrate-binding protein
MKFLRLVCLLIVGLCSARANAEEILVAVASNFTAAMNALVAEFEQSNDHKVKVAFGSTGRFYAQIKNGAPFQVFLSADQATAAALEQDGLAVPGSRFTYALGALVLWSHAATVDETRVTKGNYRKLALANPKLAPYGVAAMEVLDSLNLTASTQARWVMGENIAQTYQFVSSGNADLGFVALAQIVDKKHKQQGSLWIIPPHLYRPIRQDAVLLQRGQSSVAARQFLEFMQTDSAKKIITSYGYTTSIEQAN